MLNTNGDGFVDASGIGAMSGRRFARLDDSGDGKVSAEGCEASGSKWRGRLGARGRGPSGGMERPDN